MKIVEFEIEGRVQGVGYRNFAESVAKKLAIYGWVMNTPERDVLIHAQGEDKRLKLFESELKKGPILSKVTKIKKKEVTTGESFTDFSIRG